MGTIANLNYTDNLASSKKPFLTDLRETLDSIEAYINDKGTENLQALSLDCFPSGYAFDNDGLKQFATYNLFDKQTGINSYTGGDVTISTVGSFTDIDASNAKITFTPDLLAGDFRVDCQFSLSLLTSNATNEVDIKFRLVDGNGTASTRIARTRYVSGVSGSRLLIPINLSYTFDSLAASAQTVKAQYYITTSTAATIIIEANTNSPFVMSVEKT